MKNVNYCCKIIFTYNNFFVADWPPFKLPLGVFKCGVTQSAYIPLHGVYSASVFMNFSHINKSSEISIQKSVIV